MFILTAIADLIQIPPHEFYKKSRDEIEDKINEKFSNKILPKIGLCVCMFDLLKVSDGLIGHGTGNVNVNVEFRMIVFRPFKGEIITGSIKKCTPRGIQITTQFFDDIFVPKTMLFEGVTYDQSESTWVWKTNESELWFDEGTIVNVRVEAETWAESVPKRSEVNVDGGEDEKSHALYSIEASMAEAGLGGVEWW